jgi:uncharacterized protein
MDHTYNCRATIPDQTLSIHIESLERGARVFDATLGLHRRELTRGSLSRTTVRYPFGTVRVLALIYMHALGLRLAGAHVFPQRRGQGTSAARSG